MFSGKRTAFTNKIERIESITKHNEQHDISNIFAFQTLVSRVVSIVNFLKFDRDRQLQTNDIELSRGAIDFKISLG